MTQYRHLRVVPRDALPQTPVGVKRSPYLVGRAYDLAFFIGAPWLALGLAVLCYQIFSNGDSLFAVPRPGVSALLVLLIGPLLAQAHIILTVFRTHLNRDVFRQHRWQFTLAPLAIFVVMAFSMTALVIARVVSQFWDFYHSSLQTFGFARLYDRRAGNDPEVGRRLDIALAHVLYLGPILAGVNLINPLAYLVPFEELGWHWLATLPGRILVYDPLLRNLVVIATLLVVATYVGFYVRLHRAGKYQVSWPKLLLLGSTAIASVIAWGYLPWVVGLMAMNFFHAWQYFGLVWWTERRNVATVLHVDKRRAAGAIVALVMLVVAFGYSLARREWNGTTQIIASIALTCSMMHFWWDGFIWSVRKGEV